MSQDWILTPPSQPGSDLVHLAGGNAIVAQLLVQRGFDTVARARAFLDPNEYTPAPPESLYGLDHAADTALREIAQGHSILVWGDFDVDGQTSTTLLLSALRKLAGPDRVRYHVPNRFREGHGMRVEMLEELLSSSSFTPHCIITCDTGIADGPAIGHAKDSGLTVIVTDHHDPDPELVAAAEGGWPIWGAQAGGVGEHSVRRADAIVDPKFQPAGDPLAALPGVGVAYKLVEALFARSGRAGEECEYLDLVALGIVADVATQVDDTRYLLQRGLEQIRRTQRTGLLALLEVAGVEAKNVNSETIGFQLGPRMNALGRLEDASEAVELLTTSDPVLAAQLASKMERLNQRRRLLTSQITGAALTMVEHRPQYLDRNALVLGHETWHPGIVGIVAARLVEEFHKPAVLLVTPKDGPARGSARSIPSVDIGASIAACSAVLTQYGGHPGAAGVTLPRENVDRFRELLDRCVLEHTIDDAPLGLAIDAALPFDRVTLELVDALNLLAPYGNGNPMPTFSTPAIHVVEHRRIGKQESHRRLRVQDASDTEQTLLWWNAGESMLPPEPFDLAYTLGVNEYRGTRSVQLYYVDSRRSELPSVTVDGKRQAIATIRDLRGQMVDYADLPQPPDAVWYAEGVTGSGRDGRPPYAPRQAIAPDAAPILVVWSTPPAAELLSWMQERVHPREIVLCGTEPANDSLQSLLRQVAGMCKYAVERDGVLDFARMAARLATTESVIWRSLLLLEANGVVAIDEQEETGELLVRPGAGLAVDGEQADHRAQLQADMEAELAEVRAYKRYYLRASVAALGLAGEVED